MCAAQLCMGRRSHEDKNAENEEGETEIEEKMRRKKWIKKETKKRWRIWR